MNTPKLNQLLAAARRDTPPEPPAEFADAVLRAVRREPAPSRVQPVTLGEQLGRLFPRAGLAAAVVILLCVGLDWGATQAGWPGMNDAVSQASATWLLNPEDL